MPRDRAAWQLERKALRTTILLLGFTLLTVAARMLIEGPSLLPALTAAVIGALLLGSLRLTQRARRVRPGSEPDTDRTGTASAGQR